MFINTWQFDPVPITSNFIVELNNCQPESDLAYLLHAMWSTGWAIFVCPLSYISSIPILVYIYHDKKKVQWFKVRSKTD